MNESTTAAGQPIGGKERWLNRDVAGMGLTSLLCDAGHEMATAVLPTFLTALGAPPVALGVIEGAADALSSMVKLIAGWWSDRVGHRKPFVVMGYALTGVSTGAFALASGWGLILGARMLGWLGRGLRSPLRNAMLAQAVPAAHRGKAFGFHRAMDTIGAVAGPLIAAGAVALLAGHAPTDGERLYRWLFLLTLIPGLGAALTFAVMVREKPHETRPMKNLIGSIAELPRGYRRLLVGVGVFGMGDFSHTLLILAATQSLIAGGMGATAAATIAALLYALRNMVHAATAYLAGALGDRVDRRAILTAGYALGVLVMAGFALLMLAEHRPLWAIIGLMSLAGTYVAVEEALEGAITADLVPDESMRGTAYGVLGVVNGVGDLISSVVVGALWSRDPALGFGFAATMMLAGTAALRWVR